MAEFTAIETQEQFDEAIRDRLDRANKKHKEELASVTEKLNALQTENEKLKNTLSEHETKYADFDKQAQQIADLTAKVSNYETLSAKRDIADEFGLPKDLRDRIKGSNADEWRADAEALSKLFKSNNIAPLANPEGAPSEGDRHTEALRKVLNGLKSS